MGYNVPISFRTVKDKSEIIDIITEITDRIWENRESIIHDFKGFAPECCKETGKPAKDSSYLHKYLQITIIYWEEYSLVGIYGPKQELFQDRFPVLVEFQDECDQDYEYDTWDGIPIFEQLRDRILNTPTEALLMFIQKHIDEDFTLEEVLEDEDYERKTALYTLIEDTLEIPKWITGSTPAKFRSFCVNPLYGLERHWEVHDINRQVPGENP